MDWEELRNLASATSIATAVINLADRMGGTKPTLRVRVKGTGGGSALDFAAYVSEIANKVPAFEVKLFAEILGTDWRYEAPAFNLSAGQIDRHVSIAVPRPNYGTLVDEANQHQTLYGRDLEVVVISEEGAYAIDRWHEDEYDAETNRARWELMQRVWAEGRALDQ